MLSVHGCAAACPVVSVMHLPHAAWGLGIVLLHGCAWAVEVAGCIVATCAHAC